MLGVAQAAADISKNGRQGCWLVSTFRLMRTILLASAIRATCGLLRCSTSRSNKPILDWSGLMCIIKARALDHHHSQICVAALADATKI